MTEPRTYSAQDVLKITGASYRQIDYVINKFNCLNMVDSNPSSGHSRQFTKLGVTQMWLITQLTNVGFMTAKAVQIMEAMVERMDDTDGEPAGYKSVWLDTESRTQLDFILEYYQGRAGDEWQIPWEKASTQEGRASVHRSTTGASQPSEKTGLPREFKMLMRGYGAPSIEVDIRIMEGGKFFQVTNVEVAGGSSSGHVQIEETSSGSSSSDNNSQTGVV